MRLDLFLKTSRLIPRRPLAQKFCDAGLIRVNGLAAKSSRTVKEGDLIEIKKPGRLVRARVLVVPQKKQVSKSAAAGLYEVISIEELPDELFD